MNRYKITCHEMVERPPKHEDATPIWDHVTLYEQTVPELNLKRLIDAVNPAARKRKAKGSSEDDKMRTSFGPLVKRKTP